MSSRNHGKTLRRAAVATAALALVGGGTAVAVAQQAPTRQAGPRADGTAVTPLGYDVKPAGSQTTLGDLPLGSALSPDGKLLLVSNDGQGTQSLQVVDTATSQVVQTIPYTHPAGLFVGVAFSPDGSTAYASGGGDQTIHVYDVSGGRLTEKAPIQLPTTNPAGAKVNMFPAGLAVTPDGSRLVVADHLGDAASVVDLATGAVTTTPVGHAPQGVAVSADGTRAWVTNQGGSTVSVLDLTGPAPVETKQVTVGTHPNAVLLSGDHHSLYVADGESDHVSVLDPDTGAVRSTIDLAPYAGAKAGTTPFGLAESPDGQRLFVTYAGNNAVGVVDTATGKPAGMIPTGWYPTGVVATGSQLFVLNAKGLGAGPNDGPGHVDPTSPQTTPQDQYVGSMIKGTLSTVPLPISSADLASDTAAVRANDGFDKPRTTASTPAIKHVIYVVQENRTFDQVFGSLGKGDGDPSLDLFGQESAPNQRALQRRFVTLDNFYANAEISAQGWNWTVSANSNPYSEAMWPSNYSGRGGTYPSEISDPATVPNKSLKDAYIWQRLAAKGISFRNYGFYVNADAQGKMAGTDPVLDAHTDHDFLGFDLACPDNPDTFTARRAGCGTPRFTEWKKEFDGYVKHGNLPSLEMVRLPNDHTSGTKPSYPTPRAYVADNDLALGRLVQAVSHSRYWKSTAIFVTEDDAQNGPDHVDAHRTISQVISPYTQHGRVDSSFYSTASMLRTIENILGVAPMTQFDTFATPMTRAFSSTRNAKAYSAVRPSEAGEHTNTKSAPMAGVSARQQLGREDAIDERLFNMAIWESVKGAGSRMPAPRSWLPSETNSDD
ncbi:MAG: alkaline phosphatase family protein [Nocardioides sp.]